MFAYWTVNLLPPPCFLRCSRSSHAWNLFDLAERLWEDDRLLQPPLSGFRIYCGRKPIWVQIGRAESKTCFQQHSFMRGHLILWRYISMRRRAGNGGCCMATTVPSDTGLRPSLFDTLNDSAATSTVPWFMRNPTPAPAWAPAATPMGTSPTSGCLESSTAPDGILTTQSGCYSAENYAQRLWKEPRIYFGGPGRSHPDCP